MTDIKESTREDSEKGVSVSDTHSDAYHFILFNSKRIRSVIIESVSPKIAKLKVVVKDKLYPKAKQFKVAIRERLYPQVKLIKVEANKRFSPQAREIKAFLKERILPKFRELKVFIIGQETIEDKSLTTKKSLPGSFTEWTDHSASLNQGRHWSSTIIALCTTMFLGAFLWAFTAKLDQTITVRGRLQPSGSVREVESPSSGVVSKVFIKDGDVVSSGQPLFVVEAKGLASKRLAFSNTLAILEVQARSLRAIVNSQGDPVQLIAMPALPVIDDPGLAAKLFTARQQSQLILSQLAQLSNRLNSRSKTLKLQEQIANDLKPLYEVGAIARNQYLNQLNQVQIVRADVQTLKEERVRVIAQAAAQLNQLDREIIGLRSELVGLGETLEYRTVKAPIDGKVFDAKVTPYSVINGAETVLKIVPDNRLEATVQISNKDIGFVRTGMSVNVSVDSFPSGEFGYLEGTLISIGSDALPPSSVTPEYSFPATISLEQQEVESGGKMLNLQSGMGVNANIKLRSRPVISLLTDLFTKQIEGVSRFR